MKPAPFDYVEAHSLEDATSALASGGDMVKLLAGGQSLVPLLALRLARPDTVVDVNRVPGLDEISLDDAQLRLGALVRHRAVERHSELAAAFPIVSEAASKIGHVAIRNRGTVGGSVAHADPAAEWPALLLALDGEVEVASVRGRRVVPAEELFVSYLTTSLEYDEMISEVRLARPPKGSRTSFLELARRDGDFAIVGVAAVLCLKNGEVSHCRIALSGVGGTPVRARAAEARLVGTSASPSEIEAAAEAITEEIEPSGDIHGSADYRKKVARVLTRRALVAASQGIDREVTA